MRRWSLMLLALGLAALAGAAATDDGTTVAEQFVIKKVGGRVAGRLSTTDGGAVVELFDMGAEEAAAPAPRDRAKDRDADRPAIKPGSRASLTLSPEGVSSLALRDAAGRTRFQVATDDDGATTLAILDGRGNAVWGVRTDAVGRVRLQTQPSVTPTGALDKRQ